MTESKHRKLRSAEIDDWFDNEVTRQFFEHIRIDLDGELSYRMRGGCYSPANPFATAEAMARSTAKEEIMQAYGSPEVARVVLEEGFEEDAGA